MKVTVTGINTDEAVLVRGTSALGWPGTFGCPVVTGEAIFIPARGYEHDLRIGRELTVEASYNAIDNLEIVAGSEIESMQPLREPYSYKVCGSVTNATNAGNVSVVVRGFAFTLERGDLDGVAPSAGDKLRFELHGLTLWDVR